MLVYETIVVGQLQTNCTLLANETTGKAIVIDAGDDAARIAALARKWNVEIVGIYATHGHADHILAAGELQQLCPGAKLAVHQNDEFWWNNCARQLRAMGIQRDVTLPEPDVWLRGDESLDVVPGLKGECLFTPGHTRGSTSFYFPALDLVCTGDTLFWTNVGRTDLFDGDHSLLATSIRLQLYRLPEQTKVIPGHGPLTTIGFEKEHNMFVRAQDTEEGDAQGGSQSVHPYLSSAQSSIIGPCCCCRAHL